MLMKKGAFVLSYRHIAAVVCLLFLAAAFLAFAVPAVSGRAMTGRTARSTVSGPSKETYSILIVLEENRLYLLEGGRPFKTYRCATGKSETPSPTGNFKIIRKAHWGEGFGGYWLGIDCPWGTYGIHGTTRPDTIGFHASHGCIRMFNRDCEELYRLVPLYTQVVIAAGCYGPFTYGFRPVRPHLYGQDVFVMQKRLKELGYYKGALSGRYDSYGFKTAVHLFQKDNGLPVSDIVDEKTASALGFVWME
jgi:hypothetical protein